MTNFFVVGDKEEPILCGAGNLGASKQFIARIGDIGTKRWDISTYSIPLKSDKNPDDAVADTAYARRLVYMPESKLHAIRDIVAPPGREYKQLTVAVLRGKNLAVKDLMTSDPFVSVHFGSQKFKTSIQKVFSLSLSLPPLPFTSLFPISYFYNRTP